MNQTTPPPEDLAGYQHITCGIVQDGDVIVTGELRIKRWAEASLYGEPISGIHPYLDVYRKMECPRHEGQTSFNRAADTAKLEGMIRDGKLFVRGDGQRLPLPDSLIQPSNLVQMKTGSLRENKKGKGRFDLIPYEPTRQLAVHFEEGGVRHGDRNWELGQPLSTYLNSAKRHAAQAGSMKDENHAISACWNFFCLIQTAKWIQEGKLPKELDDIGWNSKE